MMRYLFALIGMLTSFHASLCPQSAGPNHLGQEDPAIKAPAQTQQSAASDAHRREVFRRAGERNVLSASALRRKQTGKDFADAIALLQRSAQLFQLGQSYAQAADAYVQIGEIYFTSSKYDKALTSYRRGLTLAGNDPEPRCRALSHIARTYATMGHSSDADNYSQQALSLSEGLSNRRTQAEAQEARGEALYWSGDALHSVEFFVHARDLFAEAKDDDGQALALLMLGEARYRGDRSESLRLAQQALRLWSDEKNSYGAAQAQAFLGTASALAGQYETARCNCLQALPVFQRVSDWDSAAIVLNNLGLTSMQIGDAEKSLEYYRQARDAFASAGDRLGEPEAITGMGTALAAMGRYTPLLPLYRVKLRLGRLAGNPNLVASALADMAGVYELKRRYLKAEALYMRGLAGYRKAHNPLGEGKFLIRLARVYIEEGKYSQAISFLEQARPLKEKAGQVDELAKIDYELAYVYRRLNRVDDALQAIQRTIGIIESQRLQMSAFDSRASYFASVHEYYSLYVQMLMLKHSQDRQSQLAVTAFEASEKSKVRSLLDWLAGSSQDAPCIDLLKTQAEIADVTAASLAADSSAASSSQSSPALTLSQIRAEIAGDDAILLEYALGDEKSYVWVVNGEQISAYELPAAKRVSELSQGLRNAITAQQPRAEESNQEYLGRIRKADLDYRRFSAALSRLLLGQVPLGPAKRVIIVPDGPLQYVPFAALSVPDDRGGRAILAAAHEVIILPSASALGALRKAVGRRPPPISVAAVFADPVFERDDHDVLRAGDRHAPRKQDGLLTAGSRGPGVEPFSKNIPRLRFSHEEALAVKKLGREKDVFVAERFLASRDTVLHHGLDNYRIVHFATHGILDGKHPERSGLILSRFDKKGQPQDGYLRLSDIYNLKLSADLVVLSSCDSVLGKDLSSEGIIGLPRAFLRAGAKSVIATLWKVDDEATAKLMTGFYAHLSEGESPSSALRTAQLELSRVEQWSHPYYWAAFVLQGDYR